MREIKFRAWNKRKGWKNKDGSPCEPAMEYKDFIIFPESGECNFPQSGWDINGENENKDDFILMQYTGLKDKNGKEIYEGDIVKMGDMLGDVRFRSNAIQYDGEGKYLMTGWYWGNKAADRYKTYWPLEEGGEVIGNIYENPELLT